MRQSCIVFGVVIEIGHDGTEAWRHRKSKCEENTEERKEKARSCLKSVVIMVLELK
jgi:hypothetical protein